MKKTLVVAAMLLLGSAGAANAAIIYDFVGVTPLGGGVFQYAYDAKLDQNQKVNTATGPAFAVIYDFGGYIPGSFNTINVIAGLAAVSTAELLTFPTPAFQAAADNAGLFNLRTQLSGAFSSAVQATIFRVVANSTFAAPNGFVQESAQALKNVPGDPTDNTVTGNSVLVEGPQQITTVPEPTSLLLLGTGLVGLATRLRRRS